MSSNTSNLTAQALVGLFNDCSSPDVATIRRAEQVLAQTSQDRLFVTTLLQLIAAQNASIPSTVRQLAAIYLKTHVKKYWDVPESSGGLRDTDRVLLKSQIIELALQTAHERSSHTQVATVVQYIAALDFPSDWPTLVPTLSQRCFGAAAQTDAVSALTALELLDEVLQRYRRESRSNEILHELKFDVLPHVAEPVVKLLTDAVSSLASCPKFGATQTPSQQGSALLSPPCNLEEMLLRQSESSCRILLSLISIDLPEYIEDQASQLQQAFTYLLGYKNPNFSGAATGTGLPGVLENLQAEVCRFLTIYAQRYCEEFEPLCMPCTSAILDLLIMTASDVSQLTYLDDLVSAAMLYLGAVARFKWTPCPFSEPTNRLQDICRFLIIPNLQLRDQDIELIEDNPQEFVRRCLEGAEGNTRRGAAVELVHALMQCFDAQISAILPQYVTQLLSAAKEAPPQSLQAQRLKDAAVYLVIALVVKAQSRTFGVSEIRTSVDIPAFFVHIAAEIVVPASQGSNIENTLIRCSTLKFIATVRNQLDKGTLLQLLPEIAKNLLLPDPVIHTHAAYCLENVLLARDVPNQQNTEQLNGRTITDRGNLKFASQELHTVLVPALDSLLRLIASDGVGMPENEYLMRCVMKIIIFLQNLLSPVVLPTLTSLRDLLKKQSDSSSNPMFAHFLFESIALCTHIAAQAGRHAEAEQVLLETFSTIIMQPDHDFVPYVLQLMGLLLDTAAVASSLYVQLLDHLLEPNQWAVSVARVPGIVRVLSAFFRKQEVFKTFLQQRLETIMLRFQYCLNHKRLCLVAFDLLEDMLTYLPVDFFTPFLQPLVMTLLRRIQAGKTPKLAQRVAFSLSLLTCRSDAVVLPKVLNAIQPNLAPDFLMNVFLPACKESLESVSQKKVSLLATAKLCTTPEVQSNPRLLTLAIETCASLMGVVQTNDDDTARQRTKTVVAEKSLGSSDTFIYDKPSHEFQGSFNVLQAAKVAQSTTDISQVTPAVFLNNIRQCFDNATLAAQAQTVPAWSQIVALLAAAG